MLFCILWHMMGDRCLVRGTLVLYGQYQAIKWPQLMNELLALSSIVVQPCPLALLFFLPSF